MNEIEKIQYAKMFIDKMANGVNPIDDTPVPENDLLNNVRISRCLFYVSGVLQQVIEHGGKTKKKETKKEFYITDEILNDFSYSEVPISITELVKRINCLVDSEIYKALSYKRITDWLVEIAMLEIIATPEGKSRKQPTQNGRALGISADKRNGPNGDYIAVLYNKKAQAFIIDNLVGVIGKS